ncbi:MAG TPA: penicillin-binding transpeptidase domain-containing protein [Microbacteriaceae bacterium]|nr:penicillin-binding transpeptidase domain-containing protein [Microbacteriaceae bacterium]
MSTGAGITKNLRRVSIVVIAMFAALFISTSIIQVGVADELRADDRNRRTTLASQNVNRGPILVQGEPIAQSVATDGEIRYQRVYANGPLYAPITGRYTLDGLNTGLEAAFDDYLTASTGGQFFDLANAVLTGREPQGAAVETTIDAYLQQVAWDALGDFTGAVVAMEPATGRILAMVSKPTYDPNLLAAHDPDAVEATYDLLTEDPGEPLINRAMNGDLDPPGSTFKLVTAAAALDSGRFTPDSTFPNPGQLQLPQSSAVIYNASGGSCGGGDTVTLTDAIRLSCNIPIAELADQLGYQPIKSMAGALGFCHGYDVARVQPVIEYGCTAFDDLDLSPMYSTPSWYPPAPDEPQTMLSSFGQSSVRASPLQMAMVAAAIGNQGVLMAPTLVDSVISPDQTPLVTVEPQTLGQPMTTATARAVTAMMVASVDSGAAENAAIEGVSVAGKTGTAENGAGQPYTLWFTGFAPAENPQIVVAVVVQDGGGLPQEEQLSSTLSAPIGKAVLEAAIRR